VSEGIDGPAATESGLDPAGVASSHMGAETDEPNKGVRRQWDGEPPAAPGIGTAKAMRRPEPVQSQCLNLHRTLGAWRHAG
jgi:hypothetical protein